MTRALPRTTFHSSTLVRRLADLSLLEAADPGDGFAETLGQWIHFADAIALSAVHNGGAAASAKMPPAARDQVRASASAECRRVHDMLANAILTSCSRDGARTHIKLPEPDVELPLKVAAAYAPYRRFYEAHQRDMEVQIQPLRFNVRDAVAKISPGLGKLAELDALLEKILSERESRLLAKVPALLGKRFAQLFKEHQQALDDAGKADNPALWSQAGGWLARFCRDMQSLLLAELDLRLQPTLGLIEALTQDTP